MQEFGSKTSITTAEQIIDRLAANSSDMFSVRTDTREEYELLVEAARRGLFPDRLRLGRKGVWVQKNLVHAPSRNS
jgi:hypothetical protein